MFPMAEHVEKESPKSYSFHSLQGSSATAAADNGASVQEMIDLIGWQIPSMPQKNVSSSKAATKNLLRFRVHLS